MALRYIGLFLVLIGLLALFGVVRLLRRRSWTRVEGEITHCDAERVETVGPTNTRRQLWRYRVRFTTPEGTREAVERTVPYSFDRGETVLVRYRHGDPQTAEVPRAGIEAGTTRPLVIAVILLGVGAFLLYLG